ncbi:MAG TPA: carbohydrate ABC transporter permease [Sphaerochaeta sp.]|jgi:N-acetylglucosamine transport system permease protein|nr:MAG: carbohydrate ABC transporter permease [Sphaerochaeta sp.]HOE88478.1 carbohydrate ABC transporter permease [Sphaerochaeta sp.]HOR79630.1 carbohydrate ABC transporter permease [Sphaerochaeta sp.]HPK63388.1 carbohydrate ABC transporter permease [Sphaerochaeta sp.]
MARKSVTFEMRNQKRLIPSYIVIVTWVVFTFVLIGWVIFASLSTSQEIFSDHMFRFESGFHFENYARAWRTQKVSVYFMNSVLYTVISCTAIILIAAPAAYVLSRFRFKGNLLIQNMIASALGIPAIMIVMPLFGLVSRLRLTNNRWLLIFLYVSMNVPFATFFLLSFFKNLSSTYEEAAAIDGCSPTGTFWRIMLPLVQPGIITVTVFNFITIWNEYFMSMIFANKTTVRPVSVGLFNMIQAMRYTGDWGGMFASVVIVFAPTFILYIFLSERIIQGVTAGAIKG